VSSKIIVVSPKLNISGGVSSYWNALIPELTKYYNINNFQVGGHGKNIFGPIIDQLKFKKEIQKKSDLVFLNPSLGSKSFFRDALLIKQIIKKRIPFIVFFHGWNLDFEKSVDKKYVNFFLSTFGQAKTIFVLSNDFKNKILKWGYQGKIILETTNVESTLISNFSTKDKFNKINHSSKIKILFLARLLREKGVFETVEAFRILNEKYNNIELIIAGDGKDLNELKDFVKNDKNIIVTGYVEGQNKIDLFKDSHIYCFPTFYGEGLPTSILEAMAFAMPVITTNMGGLKEFFQDNKMGYFVEPQNILELKNKLELLLLNHENIINIGRYNSNYANEKLLNTVVAKRINTYIQEAINE
jgi:glycosyltransferase involved in cell wall biosynthesis